MTLLSMLYMNKTNKQTVVHISKCRYVVCESCNQRKLLVGVLLSLPYFKNSRTLNSFISPIFGLLAKLLCLGSVGGVTLRHPKILRY